ncbi:hypothetical protein NL676_018362 [Syzygium grande]|nr:hypothetical protein NL676_018362 [Syzygium grande]
MDTEQWLVSGLLCKIEISPESAHWKRRPAVKVPKLQRVVECIECSWSLAWAGSAKTKKAASRYSCRCSIGLCQCWRVANRSSSGNAKGRR